MTYISCKNPTIASYKITDLPSHKDRSTIKRIQHWFTTKLRKKTQRFTAKLKLIFFFAIINKMKERLHCVNMHIFVLHLKFNPNSLTISQAEEITCYKQYRACLAWLIYTNKQEVKWLQSIPCLPWLVCVHETLHHPCMFFFWI